MNIDWQYQARRWQEIAEQHISDSEKFLCIMTEQDAEIERLNNQISELQTIHGKLHARAADALEHESWVSEEQCGLPSQFYGLIQELREAAK